LDVKGKAPEVKMLFLPSYATPGLPRCESRYNLISWIITFRFTFFEVISGVIDTYNDTKFIYALHIYEITQRKKEKMYSSAIIECLSLETIKTATVFNRKKINK
jgi:hypothetical protein